MMGPKKLSGIRRELAEAVAKSGEDPVRWLEEQMKGGHGRPDASNEVLASLHRILGSATRGRRRRGQRVRKPVSRK
jgi:hypothetical protein